MIRRIVLSVFMITMTVTAVATATYAYFSDGDVLSGNTFATGDVTLGGFNVTSLNVTGLTPGVPITKTNIGVNYTGSINADLYVGARGNTSTPADYLADVLYLKIYKQGTSDLVWQGYVENLSTGWRKIATDVPAGWQAYDLEFKLASSVGNDYQGMLNTNTEILIYAVQTGGAVPSTQPYLTTGSDWFNL